MQEPRGEGRLTVSTTGLAMYYRDWGGPAEGDAPVPTVLMAHGLASSSRIYDLCAPLLADRYHVVAYDQRGHGATDKPDDGYVMPVFVEDARGLVATLQLRPPLIVAGHSWGASVVLEWAVRYPDELQAVVLIDGAITSPHDVPGTTWETTRERLAPPDWRGVTMDSLLERTARGDLGFLPAAFRRDFFAALTESAGDGTIRARLSRAHHLAILRTLWDEDLDAAYRALQRPALALLALPRVASDTSVAWIEAKRRGAERRQALQPLLQVCWIDDSIHDIPLQHPEAVAAAVESVASIVSNS